MYELPDPIEFGEPARLLPVLKEVNKEDRATSILLGTFRGVPLFAKDLLESIGQRIGTRNKIQCFSQVVLKEPKEGKLRPDGLIIIEKPKGAWLTMIESKVGSANIEKEQILSYVELAKKNNIDAIVTISNEFSALPSHHPIKFAVNEKKKIEIYHWSWLDILTKALLLQDSDEIKDTTQKFLLAEFIRFFEHEASGVKGFTQMNPEWKDVVLKVQNGTILRKQAEETINTVAAWHQESRDLSLILSRELNVIVKEKLTKKHAKLPEARIKDDADRLVSDTELCSVFDVPDAASEISVVANLSRRSLTCSMVLPAPEDRKTNKSQITWLLKQLSKTTDASLFVRAWFKGSPLSSHASLEELLNEPELLILEGKEKVLFSRFEIATTLDLAGKFSGSKVFIQQLESLVPSYYANIGQYLRAYVKPAPKPQAWVSEPAETFSNVPAGE
ncbi:hypothetical protein A9Q83_02315 [Alphaproteobacteria bacterium 46_93_T64]|nr:hypothetical protein A9Q83_02315 [Alphaproteobacteria bacterium 46_93_T64]